ncbi:FAD/NAD(P)-binding oxidoreductase family protein isoform X2 [Wolffia australiana]
MAFSLKLPPLQLCFGSKIDDNARSLARSNGWSASRVIRVRCATKRRGKRRYPSEKKELERKNKGLIPDEIENREEGFWRLYKLKVPAHKDPGKDFVGVSPPLLEAIAKVLEFPVPSLLPEDAFSVLRKSFDARKLQKEAVFVYTVEMDAKLLLSLEPRTWDFISELETKIGFVEYSTSKQETDSLRNIIHGLRRDTSTSESSNRSTTYSKKGDGLRGTQKPKVTVVGSGPAGLFASLVLVEFGAQVTMIERGQPVEQRGRDIGALVARRIFQKESNFCYGEGGAGTWSDGKLVTRIGRNNDSVQSVMRTLVDFGAPQKILVDGKPHLGTDKLVPLIRNFRQHLQGLGVEVKFGTRLDDLVVENGRVVGVNLSDLTALSDFKNQRLSCDAVVLAVGHSARDVYQMLHQHNVDLMLKDFAYSALASEVYRGRGKVPVADYRVVKYVNEGGTHNGGVEQGHSCYSFCMCPGGQVVLTSTNPSELCINGMSFSRRASKWANAALVVTISSKDLADFQHYGPLAGVEFQREFERRAAIMGGGDFVVPAQTITDFLNNKLSERPLPSSSYRMGVKAASLHELYPADVTRALQSSLLMFNHELPGFICDDGLLHGVETRTSAPVQITRHAETFESTSLRGLYPIGEGAGYAGGIVSAAVDGMYGGFALAKELGLFSGDVDSIFGKGQRGAGSTKY